MFDINLINLHLHDLRIQILLLQLRENKLGNNIIFQSQHSIQFGRNPRLDNIQIHLLQINLKIEIN